MNLLIVVLTAAGVIFGYLSWRAASKASHYAKETLDDSRVARLTLKHTPEYGGFIIANRGKDIAKDIKETSNYFNSIPPELLASIIPPTYDPRQAINRSVVVRYPFL